MMVKKVVLIIRNAGDNMNNNIRSISEYGFTLLEVMISAVILTVSLLGVAGMYGFSSKFSFEAMQYTQVINIANDVFEKLRINKTAWADYAFSNSEKINFNLVVNASNLDKEEINNLCVYSVDECKHISVVELDIRGFKKNLANAFPISSACIYLYLEKNYFSKAINAAIDVNLVVINEIESGKTTPTLEGCKSSNSAIKNYHAVTLL